MKPIFKLLAIGVLSIIVQFSDVAQAAEDSTLATFGVASVVVHHQPWLASIQRDHIHCCAGSIISESLILSAASCLRSYELTSSLTVRVGSSKAHSGGSVHNVTYIKKHEDYQYGDHRSDVVLIQVSPAFEFNEKVSPISLASKGYVVDSGTNVSVAGWGIEEELSDIELHTVQCNPESWDVQICTSSRKVCVGDAGSPLVANRVQIGVMQQDSICIELESQRIFSNVSYNLDWIVQNADALQNFTYETGEITSIQHHPWLASILWRDYFWCTGSIISESVILSSAFCFTGFMKSKLTVRVGSSETESGGSVHLVDIMSKHGKLYYNHTSGSVDDVTLLKVSPPFVFNDYVKPIQLADKSYVVDPDSDVSTVHWSRSDELENLEMRDTKFRIVDCARPVPEGQICAGLPLLKRISCSDPPLKRDYGVPLVNNGVLLGISTRISECPSPLLPRAYTDVSYYRDWINQTAVSWDSKPVEVGENSTIDLQPWLASIQLNNRHLCAGSILSESTVLTSASCLDQNFLNKYTDGWYVYVGSSSVDSGGSNHCVVDTKKHENYSLNAGSVNDVALLKVWPSFQFNSNVKPIKLASTGYIVSQYTLASIAGWKWSYNEASAILKDAKLRIVDQCTRKISNGQICVAPVNAKGCLIDIGGPLVVNGVQIGVMSLDLLCDPPQYARIYNSVSYYRDWIEVNNNVFKQLVIETPKPSLFVKWFGKFIPFYLTIKQYYNFDSTLS